eukprot:3789416-Rhodomonas_salina.1
MLIKHASIRTQQEADVMEQTRKVESFIDKIEDTVKPLLEEWRSDKNISVEEEQVSPSRSLALPCLLLSCSVTRASKATKTASLRLCFVRCVGML